MLNRGSGFFCHLGYMTSRLPTDLTWSQLQVVHCQHGICTMTINVEVFASPGCSKCGHAKEALRTLVTELGGNSIQWREVNVLEELDHAVNLGILSTPAIVIDGELVFTRLPSIKKLRNELERRLNTNSNGQQT